MSTETWRCFVAARVDDLRAALVPSVQAWSRRHDLRGLRWMPPAAWHLTLAFLGEVRPTDVPSIAAALERCGAQHGPLRVVLDGVGAFPSAARANVAWCGISGGVGLDRLATDVRRSLEVYPDGRGFAPHLTVARSRRDPVDLRGWIADAVAPAAAMEVERIELLRSHLGHGAARYEALAAAQLAAVRA